MSAWTLQKIVGWILLLAVLAIILMTFYSGKGLMRKAADFFGPFADEVFRQIGQDKKPDIKAEPAMIDMLQTLYNTLLVPGKDCVLAIYEPDLGGYKIVVRDVLGSLYLQLQNPDNQEVKLVGEKGKGIVPCIIAGDKGQAKNFYNCYIEDDPRKHTCEGTMYKTGKELVITKDSIYLDGKEYAGDRQDGKLMMFAFDDKHKCFFTTISYRWSDYNKDGMKPKLVDDVWSTSPLCERSQIKPTVDCDLIKTCEGYLDSRTCSGDPCKFENCFLAVDGRCMTCLKETACESYPQAECEKDCGNPGCKWIESENLCFDCKQEEQCSSYPTSEECEEDVCEWGCYLGIQRITGAQRPCLKCDKDTLCESFPRNSCEGISPLQQNPCNEKSCEWIVNSFYPWGICKERGSR